MYTKLTALMATLALFICGTTQARERVINVKAGDAQGLLDAIEQANQENKEKGAERLFIMLPNGTYDLGDRVLTTITGHNVTIVGESRTGTVITNKPDVKNEGISKTGTLRNMGTGLYLQDLTLKNALDYYRAGSAGRAVCLHDKGTRTICKNVCMLSYQDTYYSDGEEAQHYMENAEIHGTVDFICGAGDVYFNHCTIVCERRNPDGRGRDVIAAPRTSKTPWGYVFDGCDIYTRLSNYHFARGWHTKPRCAYLNTRLMQPEKLAATRYDPQGMRTVDSDFFEYHTTNAAGEDITPATNVVNFTLKEESRSLETIMTAEEARRFQLKKIFPDWRPEKIVEKLSKKIERLKREAF